MGVVRPVFSPQDNELTIEFRTSYNGLLLAVRATEVAKTQTHEV